MRAILLTFTAAIAICALVACGPSYQGSYPSYEAVIAQYVPPGMYQGERLEGVSGPAGSYCDCPRVWYSGRWVYYYHGRWIYWYSDCWYWYPVFYVYYWHGAPYVYVGPTKSIHKASGSTDASGSAVHHAAPPSSAHGGESFGSSPAPRPSPSSPDRDAPSSSKRKDGR
jgi:hypothetical protein